MKEELVERIRRTEEKQHLLEMFPPDNPQIENYYTGKALLANQITIMKALLELLERPQHG